jgi:hypothetical protein
VTVKAMETVAEGESPPPPPLAAPGPEAAPTRPPAPQEFRIYIPPAQHPLKKWLPHIIAGTILFLAGSYVYGCTRVLQKETAFRKGIPDISVDLENLNATGSVVTAEDVIAAIQKVGQQTGVDVDADDIVITPERVEFERLPGGQCHVGRIPDSRMHLPRWEQDRILRGVQTCDLPGWILRMDIHARARWLFNSNTITITRYAPVNDYEP